MIIRSHLNKMPEGLYKNSSTEPISVKLNMRIHLHHFTLKMYAVRSSETLVSYYTNTRRQNLEDRDLDTRVLYSLTPFPHRLALWAYSP
jgi:hypothetical protein